MLEIYTNQGRRNGDRHADAERPVSPRSSAARLRLRCSGHGPCVSETSWPTAHNAESAETIELFKTLRHSQLSPLSDRLVRGEGSYVWDTEGNRYLDFFPGWGCNLLGHCPEPVVRAVQEQVATLIHVPNTWYTEAQANGPRRCPSGASAGRRSSAIRAPRPTRRPSSWPGCTRRKERYKIITFHGGFHGRTLGRHGRHGPAEIPRRARPADGRIRIRPVRRSGRRGQADRRGNGRHHDRAGAGRRGREHAARRASCRDCASWPTTTACC